MKYSGNLKKDLIASGDRAITAKELLGKKIDREVDQILKHYMPLMDGGKFITVVIDAKLTIGKKYQKLQAKKLKAKQKQNGKAIRRRQNPISNNHKARRTTSLV